MEETTSALERATLGANEGNSHRPTIYFDSIPKELLDNILRFLSRLPAAGNWETHIPLRYVVKLLGGTITGEFGVFLEARFQTLCITKTIDCFDEYLRYGWKLRQEPMACTNSVWSALDFVRTAGGKSVRRLIVGVDMMKMVGPGASKSDIVDELLKCCPNLRCLSVVGNADIYMSRFGAQLEELEISAPENVIQQIPRYCTQLRKLTVHELTVLRATRTRPSIIDAALCASTMECLTIHNFYLPVPQIDRIRENCHGLKRISLPGTHGERNRAITNLVSSYGTQLEWAFLRDFTALQLRDIVAACTNAKFHVELCVRGTLTSTLNAVGKQLDVVRVYLNEPIPVNDELRSAWGKCTELREIELFYTTVELITAALATPRPNLKILSLKLDMRTAIGMAKEVMDVCARGCKNTVEKFQFVCPKLGDDAFDKFIAANKKTLESVSVFLFSHEAPKWTRITRKFLKCPPLKEIICWNHRLPRDLMETVVHRGIQCRDGHRAIFYEFQEYTL